MQSSLSPRSLLLQAVVAAVWLVPAAAQAVIGVSTGVNNVTGERPARQNINTLYAEAGPHWDLYIQALDLFQRQDMDDVLSYYQIMGIHGLPFVAWNGVSQVSGGGGNGYCHHGQTTFITWHRPYLALYEQTLAAIVQKVAKQYPVETSATYLEAAQTFRIPYWDWAADAHLPPATTSPTVDYVGPSGTATMRNPLYSFEFPNYPFTGGGGWGGQLLKYNSTRRCIVTTGDSAGVTDTAEGNVVLLNDAASFHDKVYAAFTQSTTFEAMATTANSGANFEDPHNGIHNDISCFSVSGRTGHMGDLNWSGFEPIFMLHHANVDRYYAMWQAINFNNSMFTTEQNGHAVYGTAAGTMTADSPLRPFAQTTNADGTAATFHTSRSCASTKTFGYTYPEINDWSQDAATLAASVRQSVNSLYGGSSSTVPAASAGDTSVEKRGGAGVSERKQAARKRAAATAALASADYSIEISVDRAEIPLPSIIDLYLVDSGSNSTNSSSSSSSNSTNSTAGTGRAKRIGSTSIMSMPTSGLSYSVTPLQRILEAEAVNSGATITFANTAAVLAHLRQRLRVAIRTPEGASVPLSSVTSLRVEVQQRVYRARASADTFPQFGTPKRYPLEVVGL